MYRGVVNPADVSRELYTVQLQPNCNEQFNEPSCVLIVELIFINNYNKDWARLSLNLLRSEFT